MLKLGAVLAIALLAFTWISIQPMTVTAQTFNPGGGQVLLPASLGPIAVNLPSGAVIVGPSVRFQWQHNSTQPARYEICVGEITQTCLDPAVLVFKITGVPGIEPLPRNQVGIGPRPGQPGFERTAVAPGALTYFYNANLPVRFQGKRLQWSVIACVASTSPGAFIGQPPENCSSSERRPLTWTLPPPMLNSPADDIVLPVVIRKGFETYPGSHAWPASMTYHELTQPVFTWGYANPQGVDHFLVCISQTNGPCPTQPGVQRHVAVALARGTLGITLTQDLTPFMGQTLYWTVAACNAAIGCVYQQQPRRLRIPLLDGSFVSIYEATQNAKCKNCHEMHRENETYLRHVQLGRFTRQDNPAAQLDGISNNCKTCHTASTGYVDFWRAPDSRRSFEKPLSYGFCSDLKVERALSAGGVGHLRDDHFILWAADRVPNLGRARWQQSIDAWVNRGAPCPCDGTNGSKKCDLNRQFIP